MSSFEWGFAGYALLVGMIGAVSVAARDFPKGLGISDVTEERLREMVGELSARFEGKEASDWNGWSENIAQARQEAETLAGQAADDDSRRPVRIVVPKKVPVVLAGTNDPEDVRRLWKEQLHRGTTGLGNVRRVGPGLKMLASGKDPCPVPGREYRVEIGKFGPTIFLVVDGKLAHSWFDAGSFGPMLESGRIGIRHWAGMDAGYRQFRVYRLAKDTKS